MIIRIRLFAPVDRWLPLAGRQEAIAGKAGLRVLHFQGHPLQACISPEVLRLHRSLHLPIHPHIPAADRGQATIPVRFGRNEEPQLTWR